MAKANKWFKPMFELDNVEPKEKKAFKNIPVKNITESDEKILINRDHVNHTLQSGIINDKDWMKNFDPVSVEDLAVNNKKILELEQLLVNMCQKSCGEILLLSGPVGCGKTATVNVLARKHDIRIAEWITPLDIDIPTDYGDYEYKEKQSTKFLDFIINAANFTSLLDNNSRKLVLIEDMPNTFMRTPSEFTIVLQQFKDRAKSPMIFICSDSHTDMKSSALSLFTNSLKEQFKIHHVMFNGVAPTILKTALKRVSDIINKKYSSLYTTPNADLIECVANSSAGDVRSAILNLHFASLKGSTYNLDVSITEKEQKTKTSRKRKQATKFNSIGKDNTISILHGVGKVLNPKRTQDGKSLTNPPLEIIEQFIGQANSFVNFLHENYLGHFSSIEDAHVAAAELSMADIFLAGWGQEKNSQEYGLYVAVTGLMLANKNPVSAWNPVRGPRNMKIKFPSSTEIPLLEENVLCKGKILASDYRSYCKIIAEKQGNTSINSISFDN